MANDSDRRRPSPRVVAGVLLLVLLAVFVAQNTGRTRIRFILPAVEAPLWIALFFATAVGVIVGLLLAQRR